MGDGPISLMDLRPMGGWEGVGSTNLQLGWKGLSGQIPGELGNLTQLTSLRLNSELSGIPPELGNLAQLTNLRLFSNLLSGSIPPELGDLVQLRDLSLGVNQLSGSIPPELGNLKHLTLLSKPAQRLHPEGNLAQLRWLGLRPNKLNQLSGLEVLDSALLSWATSALLNLSKPLSGPMPQGNLVEWLRLDNNQLSGSIPPQLGNLALLGVLRLSRNLLSGPIPPQLGNAHLEWMDLRSNQLSGGIPPQLGNLRGLEFFQLVARFRPSLASPS